MLRSAQKSNCSHNLNNWRSTANQQAQEPSTNSNSNLTADLTRSSQTWSRKLSTDVAGRSLTSSSIPNSSSKTLTSGTDQSEDVSVHDNCADENLSGSDRENDTGGTESRGQFKWGENTLVFKSGWNGWNCCTAPKGRQRQNWSCTHWNLVSSWNCSVKKHSFPPGLDSILIARTFM